MPMYQYQSPVNAINDLRKRGYTEDFNLEENCIVCNTNKFKADEFEIHPADESVVYGIESKNGLKGILVNGYGYSSESMGGEIARKLKIDAH